MKLERAVGGGWSASCASSLTVIIQIIEFVTWYAWNDCIRAVGSTLFFLARPIPALRCHQLCKCYATVHSVHVSGCRQNRLKIENSRFCDNIQGSATSNSFLALLGHHGIPREALHVRKSTYGTAMSAARWLFAVVQTLLFYRNVQQTNVQTVKVFCALTFNAWFYLSQLFCLSFSHSVLFIPVGSITACKRLNISMICEGF